MVPLPDASCSLDSGGSVTLSVDVEEDFLVAGLQSDIVRFLRGSSEEVLAPVGFSSQDEVARCEVRRAFPVFILREGPCLVFAGYWRVPILVDGEYRSQAEVKLSEGKPHLYAVGGRPLAAQLGAKAREADVAAALVSGRVALLMESQSVFLAIEGGSTDASWDGIRVIPLSWPGRPLGDGGVFLDRLSLDDLNDVLFSR